MDNMVDVRSTFAKRLKEKRRELDLTQSQVAKMSGVAQSQISGFEKEKSPPSLADAAAIAQVLGVSLDWLCGIDGGAKNITPEQWFSYTIGLIENPPEMLSLSIPAPGGSSKLQRGPLVKLTYADDGSASIRFSGKEMKDFFGMYRALNGTKDRLSPDIYRDMIGKLFDGYSDLFTPGWSAPGDYSGMYSDENVIKSIQEVAKQQ